MDYNYTKLEEQIETFLQKPEKERTADGRIKILESLGVKHPEKFLRSVWSTQWEAGVDRLLNPRSLFLRPLDRCDINFKWAKGSFNVLSPEVKSRIFSLKMKPNGVFEALKCLFAKADIQVESLEIKSVDILEKIHSEAAVTLVINGQLERVFEISHVNLAGEEIFSRIAELVQVNIEPIYVYTTPQNVKVAFETRLGRRNLLSERWTPKFFLDYGETISREVAEQDALADALGTIARDIHYKLTDTGQVYSFHHRELFHPLSEMALGFFEPIYTFLNERCKKGVREVEESFLRKSYRAYRESYLEKNGQLRKTWPELEKELLSMESLIQEYFAKEINVRKVVSEVETRIFKCDENWLDRIYEMFTEE